ncbi:MAG: hypothetical protein IPN06_09260 [Burkholderiales bacterium]|nr:hypothetical protein [Burkholderiales bacterium]
MKDKHGDAKRVFILFSENINSACLNKKQRDELQAHDPECLLLLYPEQLSQPASPAKLLFEIQSVDLYKSKRRKFLKSEIEHIRNRVNDGDSNVHLLSKNSTAAGNKLRNQGSDADLL